MQGRAFCQGIDKADQENTELQKEAVQDCGAGAYKLFQLQLAETLLDYIHFSEESSRPEDRQAFREAERWILNPKTKIWLAGEKFTFPEAVSYFLDLPMDGLAFEEQLADMKKALMLAGSNYTCYLENKENKDCGGIPRRCGSCPKFNGKENYDPRSILFPPIRQSQKEN